MMRLSLSTMKFLVVATCRTLGQRLDTPIHTAREVLTRIKLPVVIFKASMLSEDKGIFFFLGMVLPEGLEILKFFDHVVNNQETE